jgi:uncharacterized protein (TIGR02001 family)
MKTLLRTSLLLGLLPVTGVANADWSANIGYASEYYYRGFFQKNSSASAGVDYESGGFYVGTWAADVGDGLEVDVYGGYGTDVGDVSLSVGFTGYYYTGDFDDTYEEINLGAGLGGFSLDVAIGQYDAGPTQDYTYASLTYEKNGFYGKYATFSQDFDGSYFEAGYGTTVAEIDLGVSLIFADKDIAGDNDEAIVFTIGKSFDL